jgi:hypothetical protein
MFLTFPTLGSTFQASRGTKEGLRRSVGDRIEDSQSAYPRYVAQDVVDLQIHLTRRLLHMQGVFRSHLQQTAAMPPQTAYDADDIGWWEAGPQ